MPHLDDGGHYKICWNDGEVQVAGIPEIWLDLAGFMVARHLLAQGYDPHRLVVVRLQGADYELMRAPLGAAARCRW